MKSQAKNVDDYLKELPEDRRNSIEKVREVILDNLPEGYEETVNWGMISYEIPLSVYPKTYNGQPLAYAAIANQKNYLAIYLMGVYANPGGEEKFREEWAKTGKKLDMGKSCIRFQKLDDISLPVIADAISSSSPEQYIKFYEANRGSR